MKLKLKGNPVPADSTVDCYRRAARVAEGSDNAAERAVGKVVYMALGECPDNATDAVMTILAQFDAATRRIREELRGIHS